jgi:hypothetical protein
MRRGLVGLLLALLMLLAASCSTLIGADEYKDSADAICGMVSTCYSEEDPGCGDRVRNRLNRASAPIRSQWLTALSDSGCLSSCNAARRCLDLLPMCDRKSCDRKENCCGFLSGTVRCESGGCCDKAGASCDPDNPTCCPDVAGGCSVTTRTCGGIFCRKLGDPCVNSFDCCSESCQRGVCAELCAGDKFECDRHGDCCSGYCNPETKRCQTSPCLEQGEACGASGSRPCCGEPVGLECREMLDGRKLCATDVTCLPSGAECTRDENCCDELCDSGRCSKPCGTQGDRCSQEEPCCLGLCGDGTCTCTAGGGECSAAFECCTGVCIGGACACSNEACTRDENCCSGTCIGGACKPDCGTADCTHSECDMGGPLQDAECAGVGPIDPACVEEICAVDDFCCCQQWDFRCVEHAYTRSADEGSKCFNRCL